MVLNFVWLSMFFLAGACGLLRWLDGADPNVFATMTTALFDSAQSAVMLLIGLAGSLMFWMGILKIAEHAGAVQRVARLMAPLLRRVFPGLPMEHPAAGAMVLNFAANALGIDNAATPTGLKAMRELQTLNPNPEIASNHQVMFMVLHAASLTLFPVGIIALRAAAGAAQPADLFLPILFASLASALGGFISVALVQRLRLADPVLLLMLVAAIAVPGVALWQLSKLPAAQMQTLSTQLAGVLLFAAILWFLALAAIKRIDAWSAFIEGAREGLASTVQIAPYLVGMLVAIGVLRASGGLDLIVGGIWSLLSWTGLPAQTADALPTMLMKPLSGSGARGLMVETMQRFGADSYAGRLACLFQGGTDTTFYVISLYSGAAGLKRLRHTLPCALIADLAGFAAAIALAALLFRPTA